MKQLIRNRLIRKSWTIFLTLAIVVVLGVTPAMSGETTEDQELEVREVMMEMAELISKAPAFSVTLHSSYDAIQENGQYIEFGERRHILLQRPDKIRIETERSDGEHVLVLFDGKEITVFKADHNVYSIVEKPGTLDDAIVFLVRDMQLTLPLAQMLHTGFAKTLGKKKLTAVHYVEENTLFDVVTDHLAVRSEGVDMQLWVAQSEEPLPRRVVLTYMDEPGQPQFRGDFSDWSLSPKAMTDSFTFTPPVDAEKIPVIARVRQKGSLPVNKGGE